MYPHSFLIELLRMCNKGAQMGLREPLSFLPHCETRMQEAPADEENDPYL